MPLDIVAAIHERSLWHVLGNIFDRVSPEDINSAMAVSKTWRYEITSQIIQDGPATELSR